MGARCVFITGTDTGVGKTRVTLALMNTLRDLGQRVAAMKPVATGAVTTDDGLHNEDAVLLRQYASVAMTYEQVNPYVFELPSSPHLAARKAGVTIDMEVIRRRAEELAQQADWLLVEGVGGWEVPLNDKQRVADLAHTLDMPVLLVVQLRMGALNHAFLTATAIRRAGIECCGWVANCIDPDFAFYEDYIETLRAGLDAPLLGILPTLSPDLPHGRERLQLQPAFEAWLSEPCV